DICFLTLFGAALAYAVFFLSTPVAQADRISREQRNFCLIAVGVIGLLHTIASKPWRVGSSARMRLDFIVFLAPAYVVVQLIPLPLSILRIASPARWELLQALKPVSLRPDWAPLSVAPALTLEHFLLFGGYAVVFFSVRELTRSDRNLTWLPVVPVLVVA